jgi:AcrR family transcriptional regulator
MDNVHMTTGPRRGAPPRGERLTRQRVITQAAEVIAAEGLDAFSLRRLADVLGVAPNALYNHVSSRDDLLDAVTEQAVANIQLPEGAQSWPEWVGAVAAGLRSQLSTSPGLTELVLARAGSTNGPVVLTAFLDRLETAGLDRAQAHVAWHALLTLVVGSLVQDHARPKPDDHTFEAVLEVIVTGLHTTAQRPPSAVANALLSNHELA